VKCNAGAGAIANQPDGTPAAHGTGGWGSFVDRAAQGPRGADRRGAVGEVVSPGTIDRVGPRSTRVPMPRAWLGGVVVGGSGAEGVGMDSVLGVVGGLAVGWVVRGAPTPYSVLGVLPRDRGPIQSLGDSEIALVGSVECGVPLNAHGLGRGGSLRGGADRPRRPGEVGPV